MYGNTFTAISQDPLPLENKMKMRAGAKEVSPEWWETRVPGLGRAQGKAGRVWDCCRARPGQDIKRNTSALHNGL